MVAVVRMIILKRSRIVTLVLGVPSIVFASMGVSAAAAQEQDLFSLSLEELTSQPVSIGSHAPRSWKDSAASIYIISSEDILRSGIREVPSLLSLVPGMQSARVDNSSWAINSRNEAEIVSGTMLVLMDGRVLYNPLFSGTYWSTVDVMIEDIERIEVVRGAGGAVWGSNAVTGVVNIITKSAEATQESIVSVAAGDVLIEQEIAVRTGFKLGKFAGRVFAKDVQSQASYYGQEAIFGYRATPSVEGQKAADARSLTTVGLRLDGSLTTQTDLTLSSSFYQGSKDVPHRGVSTSSGADRRALSEFHDDNEGGNIGVSVSLKPAENLSLDVAYYSDYFRHQSEQNLQKVETHDLSATLLYLLGNHEIALGGAYRTQASDFVSTAGLTLVDEEANEAVTSLFFEDRLRINQAFSVGLGAKWELHSDVDNELQPSIDLMWRTDASGAVWLKVSRATQIASRAERGSYINFNSIPQQGCQPSIGLEWNPAYGGCVRPIASKDTDNLEIYAYELGYRFDAHRDLYAELVGFYNDFKNGDVLNLAASVDRIYGLELSLDYRVTEALRLQNYITAHQAYRLTANGETERSQQLPDYRFFSKLQYDLSDRVFLDLSYLRVDSTERDDNILGMLELPAYDSVDLAVTWRITPQLESTLLVSNVLDDEYITGYSELSHQVSTVKRRGAMLSARYHW